MQDEGTTLKNKKREPSPDKTTMGVQIPNDLIQRLKVYAVEEDRSLAWHIRMAIRLYLARKDAMRGHLNKRIAERKANQTLPDAPLPAEIEEEADATAKAVIGRLEEIINRGEPIEADMIEKAMEEIKNEAWKR